MKKTIKCSKCALCATVSSAGFLSNDFLYCSQFSTEVEGDDGCTMGVNGKPFRGKLDIDVDISQHSVVYGWSDEDRPI